MSHHFELPVSTMNAENDRDAQNSPLHFARFEFKFLLSAKKRQAVENDLLNFLQYDPFVENIYDHKYLVRSLYFDTASYSAFNDKIDGIHTRSKFRLRTYSTDINQQTPVYLEIKGRHNNLVFKHRSPVKYNDLDFTQLKGDKLTKALMNNTDHSEVRDQFFVQVYKKRIRPVALIDYERRPYLSKYDPHFRLTFDEQLYATQTECLFPGANQVPKRVVAGYTILEVKFRHHLPSWFHRVIQTHELKRLSISKIVSGMEVLGMAEDENE